MLQQIKDMAPIPEYGQLLSLNREGQVLEPINHHDVAGLIAGPFLLHSRSFRAGFPHIAEMQ